MGRSFGRGAKCRASLDRLLALILTALPCLRRYGSFISISAAQSRVTLLLRCAMARP